MDILSPSPLSSSLLSSPFLSAYLSFSSDHQILLPLVLQRNIVCVCVHYILANCNVLFELTKKLTLKIGFWPPSLDLKLSQHVFQNSLKASPLMMTARKNNSKKAQK